MKRSKFSYSSVHRLISLLNNGAQDDKSLLQIVQNSSLKNESKKYFKTMVFHSEKRDFKGENDQEAFKFNKKYFKEFKDAVQREQ